MAVFVWEGRTRQGTVKKGVMEAEDTAAVMATLRSQMIIPVTVRAKSRDIELAFLQPKIKTRDLVIFTRQFATMIDAGLPLVQCLEILGSQQENPTFKKVLQAVKSDVEQGSTFADALGKHSPNPFDHLFVNLVAAGEVGGILDTIMQRLAAYLEKADKLRQQIKSAMNYPLTVVVIAAGVMVLLMVKVIPVFEKMFKDFGGELPGPTQVVVNMSHWMQAKWWILLLIVVAIWQGFKVGRRNPKFHYQTDWLALKLPIFGDLIRKVAVARFSRTMSTMLSSGVPILDALEIVARTAGNDIIQEGLMKVREAIKEGKTVAEPLAATGVFPGMVVQMVAVGEQTGAMDTMLGKVADFYEDEVDAAVAGLTSMLEPLIMVFLGGGVGGILIAMYLPIFKIAEAIK